jgi:hypothetical protein
MVCSIHSVDAIDVSVLVMVTFSHGFDLCDKVGEDEMLQWFEIELEYGSRFIL